MRILVVNHVWHKLLAMDKKDFPVYSLGNEVLGQSYIYTHNMLC